jgi:TctA family transporter
LLLGFVLGPLMEEHFRRAMVLSRGDLMTFFDRPISAAIMALIGLILIWSLWSSNGKRHTQNRVASGEEDRAQSKDDQI